MSRLTICVAWGVLFGLSAVATPVRPAAAGEGPWPALTEVADAAAEPKQTSGQEDLDRATGLKLSAQNVADLSEVIRLCESALDKGLDESNAEFARSLLVSSLIERGSAIAQRVFGTRPPSPNWKAMRESALKDLEKALKIQPKQPVALLAVAQLNLLPGGDAKRAREALDAAAEMETDQVEARVKALALRSGLERDLGKKLADLDKAVELVPHYAPAYRLRALAQLAAEKPEKALADFDRAIELDPDDTNTYIAQGQLLARLKRYDEALAAFDKAIERHPGDTATYIAQGQLLATLKRYDEALAAFEKARKTDPEALLPLLQMSRVHSLQSKPKQALADIDEALKIRAHDPGLLLLRANMLREMGQAEKALADVDEVLRLRPDSDQAMRMRSVLLAATGKVQEAIRQMEAVLKKSPDDPAVRLHLALLYNAAGQPQKTIDLCTEILREDGENWIALQGRADAALNLGRQGDAIADYEKLLELRPDEAGALNNLAWVLATSPFPHLRDGKRAIELATKACELTDYKKPHILSTLAAAYAETGDFQTAIKWSTKAVELADEKLLEPLSKELESYKAGKPCRELKAGPDAEESGEDAGESADKEPADDKPDDAMPEEPGPESLELHKPL